MRSKITTIGNTKTSSFITDQIKVNDGTPKHHSLQMQQSSLEPRMDQYSQNLCIAFLITCFIILFNKHSFNMSKNLSKFLTLRLKGTEGQKSEWKILVYCN